MHYSSGGRYPQGGGALSFFSPFSTFTEKIGGEPMNPLGGAKRLYARMMAGVLFLLLACGTGLAAEARSTADTVAELERLLKTGKFSFEEGRTVNEALASMRSLQKLKDRQEQRKDAESTLRRLLCEAADADASDRGAAITAARYLLYLGEADAALKYINRARPASGDDIEWPLLCARAYLQLGDFEKAAGMSTRVDGLLQGRSQLILSKPVPVEQVTGYRLYVPREAKKFSGADMLTLYVEISGAKFSAVTGGSRCCLDFGLELRDELQTPIDRNENYGRYDPVYNGAVRDLHATIYYRLPEKIEPGKYVLIIRCTDSLNNNTVAQTEFPVVVVADARPQVPDKAKADAAMIQKKVESGKADELFDDFTEEKQRKELEKKLKAKQEQQDTDAAKTEAQKLGLQMQIEQSKRSGKAVGE